MDIDPDIADWVLDFLLRQPLEEHTLEYLLRALPIRDTSIHLKKLILLKKLESDVTTDSISVDTLDYLEQLGEMYGGNMSDAMRHAYCAVAVESTVKAVANQDVGDEPSKYRYYDMIKRVWKGRMKILNEEGRMVGLGSDELWVWKKEIEDGAWDDDVRNRVFQKSMEINAAEAIEKYLRDEWENNMKPSFLELVDARMKTDEEFMQDVMMLDEGNVDQIATNNEKCGSDVRLADHERNGNNEIRKEKIHLRCKVAARRVSGGSRFGRSRRAKLVDDSDEITPSTEEVDRVKESIVSSSLEPQPVLKDPLPEQVNCGFASVVDGAGVDQLMVGCVEGRQENGYQDPIKKKCSVSNMAGQHGPSPADASPKVLNAPPRQNIHLNGRRQRKKWSSVEEATLIEAVRKHGIGNWKFILTVYPTKFEDRTEGDLKDKWRNMSRHGVKAT